MQGSPSRLAGHSPSQRTRSSSLRIAWAVPCLWAEPRPNGLFDVWGAGFDTMIVPRLGIEGGFRVLIRLVGQPEDFRVPHAIELTLTDPKTEPLGTLEHPVAPRAPASTARPGDEITMT